jgi:hypothetical protein
MRRAVVPALTSVALALSAAPEAALSMMTVRVAVHGASLLVPA